MRIETPGAITVKITYRLRTAHFMGFGKLHNEF
jgi:hypothetical protein